jgi:predicted metalloprotease with PDZ domain
MDNQKIYLMAEVTVLPQFLDDVKGALKEALIPTLQEAGCEGMFETSREGDKRVSAIDSSLATFTNHAKYPGRCNNSIDYYDKGMLIAFDLDAKLRVGTTRDSLDEAFRSFYERHVNDVKGYSVVDAVEFFDERLAGLGPVLDREVRDVGSLEIAGPLEALGFEVEKGAVPFLGLMFSDTSAPKIYNVLDESPAGAAGLAPDDVCLFLNDFPFSLKALSWCVSHESRVAIEISRGHRRIKFELVPIKRTEITKLFWRGNVAQRDRLRAWLHNEDFRPEQGEEVSLEFYENFHGVETVI